MTESPSITAAANTAGNDKRLSRRSFFGGALAGVSLAGVSAAAGLALTHDQTSLEQQATGDDFGADTIACHGTHQAGIVTAPTAHSRALALTLLETVDRDAVRRMLTVLTADIEALTAGRPPLADSEPQLAVKPARLTVTVGFGEALIARVNPQAVPEWLRTPLSFSRDQLDPHFNDGDLLLLIAADDQVTVSHAARMLTRSLRSFATPKWIQDGFRRSRGTEAAGTTMRNLMGQVDGTENPNPEAQDFAGTVWFDSGSGWLAGGTCMVFRRIRMELDAWDQVDRPGREAAVGRDLSVGAPLTGTKESDKPDFAAENELGLPVIPAFAHIRRAHSTDKSERIYRRSLNYDTGLEQGLLFICYQRNPHTQFGAIQQRLDELDLLNEWITHTGSAVFAIAPGWKAGQMLGQPLFAT